MRKIPTPGHSIGFKRFYSPLPLNGPEISIHGIGIREWMPPSQIERPRGKDDFLIMVFHDPASAAISPDWAQVHPPETLFIWKPRQPQYYGHSGQSYHHSWVHCDGTRIRHLLRLSGLPVARPIPVVKSVRFEECLSEIHRELVSYLSPDATIVGDLLEIALRDISRSRSELKRHAEIPEGLLRVRQWMAEAPARPVSLAELSRVAGISVPSFSLRFKQVFGVAPIDCLIQQRMQHAAHLLANRHLTVTQVGELVGYSDPFHFSKMFKKHFGMSPRVMRSSA